MTGLTPQQSNTGGLTGDRPDYSGAVGCHPNRIVDQAVRNTHTPSVVTFLNWFDPSCYTVQPFATLGNVPRDSLLGPGLLDLDFSIIKQTRITEKLNSEFRAEFFNILNHTNLGQPVGAVFAGTSAAPFISGTAGTITSTSTTSRQIQFALKLIF
jgi:hypothetical protein